jgi:hypothetical protein
MNCLLIQIQQQFKCITILKLILLQTINIKKNNEYNNDDDNKLCDVIFLLFNKRRLYQNIKKHLNRFLNSCRCQNIQI